MLSVPPPGPGVLAESCFAGFERLDVVEKPTYDAEIGRGRLTLCAPGPGVSDLALKTAALGARYARAIVDVSAR